MDPPFARCGLVSQSIGRITKTPGAAHGAQVLFKKDIEYVIQEIANETHDRPQAQCLATDTKNFR